MTAIYKITNHVNQKMYIGKTINPDKRWHRHLRKEFFDEGNV